MRGSYLTILLLLGLSLGDVSAQDKPTFHWLHFNDLDTALLQRPQKTLLYFHADWCTYCRKMEREVFTKPDIIENLDRDFHVVKFNAESQDTIFFDGQIYTNRQLGKGRNPMHQLTELLALRHGQFTPPVLLLLDENFKVISSSYQYLDNKKLLKFLEGGKE